MYDLAVTSNAIANGVVGTVTLISIAFRNRVPIRISYTYSKQPLGGLKTVRRNGAAKAVQPLELEYTCDCNLKILKT